MLKVNKKKYKNVNDIVLVLFNFDHFFTFFSVFVFDFEGVNVSWVIHRCI